MALTTAVAVARVAQAVAKAELLAAAVEAELVAAMVVKAAEGHASGGAVARSSSSSHSS